MNDFDKGFGIGGLGQLDEQQIVPSAEVLARIKRMEQAAQTCRRCKQTDLFDGAMFTTDPASAVSYTHLTLPTILLV